MRILYAAMKHDYGRPEQGLSFEHCNFYDSLVHMGHDIIYFDFVALLKAHGREAMNRRLLEVARAEKPELLFSVLFQEEMKKETIRTISDGGATATLNWFTDDHWRFEDFTRRWAPCFNWAVTTSAGALPKYERIGCRSVIKSQWACNHFLYRKLELPLTHDLTFIGQPHGNRRQTIAALRAAGLDVKTWGQGWEAGRIGQEEMIRVFNQSRINLNLANAARPAPSALKRARRAAHDWLVERLEVLPGVKEYRQRARASRIARKAARQQAEPAAAPAPAPGKALPEQIKGRNFEVPGCGGFLLTGRAENLEDYYADGKEVVIFGNDAELIEKARYYLAHEAERAAIAEAGWRRTLREHTYAHRFEEIFRAMGLAHLSPHEEAAGQMRPGATLEIR